MEYRVSITLKLDSSNCFYFSIIKNNVWVINVNLSEESKKYYKTVEYKYCVAPTENPQNIIRWELGPNRIFNLNQPPNFSKLRSKLC